MNTPTQSDTGASQWLSVADAAARLGVSAKTLRKRMARGEVAFRRVVLARGGAAYEVEMEDGLERSKAMFQTAEQTEGQTARNGSRYGSRNGTPLSVNRGEMEAVMESSKPTSITASKPMPKSSKTTLEMESEVTRLRADLEREREGAAFLRGVIESDRRDMAELRAALREALKLAPKQLAAPSPVTPDESARNDRRAMETGEVGSSGPDALNEAKTGGDRGESLSYGDVADALEALEKELNR